MKKKIKYFLVLIISVLFVTVGLNLADVLALTNHGTGDYCFTMDIDYNGFPVSKVLVNDVEWDKNEEPVFHSTDNVYTIKVYAGKKVLEGDEYPWISTAGGMDDYKTYYSMENVNEDPEVVGDEYVLVLTIHDYPVGQTCTGMGFSIQNGPLEPYHERVGSEINITIIGDELEYHYVEDKPDEADVSFFKFGINSGISEDIVPFTFGNANYTYNDKEAPKNVSRVTTKHAIYYEYEYDGSGYVTFYINGGGTEYYSSIVINGIDYSNQVPSNQVQVFEHLNDGGALIFEIQNVVYNENGYDIVVNGEQYDESCTTAGFGWSYLSHDRSPDVSVDNEGNFAHGRLEFVQAKYRDLDGVDHVFNTVQEYNAGRYHGTGQIYVWYDGRKDYIEEDRRTAWGNARVPYGTELTVRVVPDPGYQLTSFSTSPNGFQATETPGVYKIVLTKDNFSYNSNNRSFDLSPVFTQVNNETITNSEKISDVMLETNQQVENGSIKFEVKDANNIDGDKILEFESAVEGYNIDSYLDLSLYNTIYQGGKKDAKNNYLAWDTEINNLSSNATVTLALNDDMDGKDVRVVHQTHNGDEITGYVVIIPEYNQANNTITFETNSFSKFAVASRNNSNNNEPEEFTIYFDSQGGTPISPVNITSGDKLSKPEDPKNGNLEFVGWYLDEGFKQSYNFNNTVTNGFTLYAKWKEPDPISYTVNSNGNIITFSEQPNHSFTLTMFNFAGLSDEEIDNNPDFTREEYEQGLAIITNGTKEYGDLLAAYQIEVNDEDEHGIHEGPFTLKIKMTDEMKKYNTFKMIYFNDEMEVEDVITFKKQGDYLVGTLPHLSTYVLAGSIVNNPLTGDNMVKWIGILFVSSLGITICLKNKKRKVSE